MLFPELDNDETSAKLAKLWSVPIGAASPLWAAYAGLASTGVAYWWLSQWTKPQNLEAFAFKLPLMGESHLPTLIETMAAVQLQPHAPPEEPVIAPDAPEAILASAALEAGSEVVEAAVEVSEDVIEAVSEAAKVVSFTADDLTRLVGIGPTLATKLAGLGVRTFSDIASWSEDDLEKMDKALDLKGRAVREAWVNQARQFAAQ